MLVNYSLLQPVDIGGQISQGFQTGRAMVKETQTQNALKAFIANPDDPTAYSALAAFNPAAAASISSAHAARLKVLQDTQDRQRSVALGGLYNKDPQGAREEAIAAGDFDLAKTFSGFDEDQKKRTVEGFEAAAPIAFRLRQITDPAKRQALFEEAKPILAARGFKPEALANFDVTNDTALDAIISSGQKVGDLVEQGKIHWQTVPGEGGSTFAVNFMGKPVGNDNPYAQQARGALTGGTVPVVGGDGQARGVRNNNPLNLTKSGFTESQPGYVGTDDGGRYARFESPEAGLSAGRRLLGSYLARGFDTPAEIVGRWAPTGENGAASTNNYTNYVAQRLGVAPDQPVQPDMIPALMQAMAEFENGGRKGGTRRVAAAGGTPHVASKAEFNRLPSGTTFIAPDGSQRRKP